MNISNQIIHLQETTSTQDDAKNAGFGVFWTSHQTEGRGRFDRQWFTPQGEALAVSMCLNEYTQNPRPYLLGMTVATAIAESFNLELQWPNDLVLNGKKIGGILSEIHQGVPVIGIGLNLLTTTFPEELANRASSIVASGRPSISPEAALNQLIEALRDFEPIPETWSQLSDRWLKRDMTPGKVFQLTDGRVGVAQNITEEGFLLWSDTFSIEVVTVAEALWR